MIDDEKTEGGQEEAQAESLADALGSEWDKLEATTEDGEPEVVEEPTEEPEKEATEETEEEAGEDAEAEAEGGDEEAEEAVSEAPQHWSQADKDVFDGLPDEAKEPYLDARKSLEAGYDAKFKEVAEARRAQEAMDEVFKPYESQLALEGIGRPAAMKRLLAAQQMLQTRPAEAIQWLAQQYGVDLSAPSQEAESDEFVDPAVKQLHERFSRLEGVLVQQQQANQEASQQQIHETINAFRDAKDDQGNLVHPHFEQVRPMMAQIVNTGVDMESAYEQAIWAQPELREGLLKAQSEKADVTRKAEVAKAKKASRNPKSRSVASARKDGPAESWSGELERQWEQLESNP